jgi:phage terminase large subunit-like protein
MVAEATNPPSREDYIEFLDAAKKLESRLSRRFADYLFPDEDTPTPPFLRDRIDIIHARDKYPGHLEHFRAGAEYSQRCLMAANRIGKTLAGALEVSYHLTGRYPDWWEGRRFSGPTQIWAAGKTNETTRDIVQLSLLGPVLGSSTTKRLAGTGTVPGATLGTPTWKSGVQGLVDQIQVAHVSGGQSMLGLKTYEQGRGSFEGTAKHAIWFDEEPPQDVYGEALIRTATTHGITLVTFTPLEGLSDVVKGFLPADED